MERYFLLDETETTVTILSQVFTNSYQEAQTYFNAAGFSDGEILSETDWCNEIDLNNLENQSYEQ